MPMDPQRKSALQVMLNKRLYELLEEIKLLESIVDTPVPVRPRRSGAQVDSVEITESLLEIRLGSLADIRLSILRLNNDNYGVCARCQEDITESRLGSLPFATLCKTCDDTEQARIEKEVAGEMGG